MNSACHTDPPASDQTATEDSSLQAEIESVRDEIQQLQRRIAASGEPSSQLELYELQRLGRRYGTLVARLRSLSNP